MKMEAAKQPCESSKNMKGLLSFLIVLLLFVSCKTNFLTTNQKIKTISKLNCMVGNWVTYSTVYSVFETWKKINDTTFKGSSIMLVNGDTVLNEKMSIEPRKSFINLSIKNLSVPESAVDNYKLSKIKADKIEFVKLATDKHENIIYHFVTPETLRILIESDGKSIESYNMKKFIK